MKEEKKEKKTLLQEVIRSWRIGPDVVYKINDFIVSRVFLY